MTCWARLRFGRADSRVEGGNKPPTSRDDSLVIVLGEVEIWEGRVVRFTSGGM